MEFILDGKKLIDIKLLDGEIVTTLSIPNGVEIINERAFTKVEGITKLILPNTLKSILADPENKVPKWPFLDEIIVEDGNPIFYTESGCLIDGVSKTLVIGTQNAVIPKDGSVEYIYPFAFSLREGLTEIVIPSSVKKVCYMAFSATGLKSGVFESDKTEIEKCVFSLNSNIESMVFPENSPYTFISGCLYEKTSKTVLAGFSNAVIPEGTVRIEMGAFLFVKREEDLYIPPCVTEIELGNFFMFDKIIKVEKGSYAERYAIQHEKRHILITPTNNE